MRGATIGAESLGSARLAARPLRKECGEQGEQYLGQEPARRLVRGDDELYVGLAAHPVDRTRPAGSCGVLVASGFFGHSGDGAVRAADDGSGGSNGGLGPKSTT